MNKKIKTLLATALTLTLTCSVLVGCGNGSGSDNTINLEVFSNKSENKNILQNMINQFEKKNPNIKITLTDPPKAGTVLKTRLTKNDMPDILSIGGDSTYSDLVKANALEDLSNESFSKEVQKPYIDMLNQLVSSKDTKLYGVPYATNADGVIYNKDIFNKLNLQIPKTWDEFMNVVKKLEASGQLPFYFTLKDSWTGMCFWNILASDLQPNNFVQNRKANKTTFAATHGEIVDKMLELTKHGEKGILGVSYDDGNAAFAQGKAAMYLQGNWAINEIKKSNSNIHLGMFPLPASNDTSKNKIISGIDVLFAVSNKSKHVSEAKKFINFMLEKENAQKYIKDQFAFSAIKDVVQGDESVKDVQDYFKNGQIGAYPDHYYPVGLDAATVVQSLFNKNDKAKFLKDFDTEYDKANNQ